MSHFALTVSLMLLLAFVGRLSDASEEGLTQQTLFVRGEGGYNIYRIPSLIVTPRGSLLAFCEGREAGDSSDIDMLLRRSDDGGKTWSERQVVWDEGKNVCGNPCPVVDSDTGIIWLLMTWNNSEDRDEQLHEGTGKDTRRPFVCHSSDDGHTWSQPMEITEGAKRDGWLWYATGPGVGIQLRHESHKGRLVIPCDYTDKDGFGSHVILSDDHGKTWRIGGTVSGGANECQVVELRDGTLVLNMRMQHNGDGRRGLATSRDGGETWSELVLDATLVDPICQASLIRYACSETDEGDVLLFSNPAAPPLPGKTKRERAQMTVRLSLDGGKTWPFARLLHEGFSAYSCLAVMPDGTIGCLYEGGETAYSEIVFARFALGWLKTISLEKQDSQANE
ncbi:MAG TPA: sialidase family protein [bacterium]|nr:sialidase family protein [bacterium]